MIIVHLITRWLRAGAEENTLETCRAQLAAGHRVILVHGASSDPEALQPLEGMLELHHVGTMVHRLSPMRDLLGLLAITRLLRQIKPDLVHTHQSKAGVLGRMGAHLAGVPVIVHGVHIIPWDQVDWARRFMYLTAERISAWFTDAFVSVSPAVRDESLNNGVGKTADHFVAYSGVDVARFAGASWPEDWPTLLAVREGDAKPTVIAMLAAFERRKRHLELIEVIAPQLKRSPGVVLLLAGEGPGLKEVQARVAELKLERQVRFAGFRTDPERIVALADVCLLTSEREGLPRVVVQYVAGRKPTVATYTLALRDVVTNGENALVVETVEEAAAAALRLARDQGERERLAAGAAATDISRWSLERMQGAIEVAYAHACERAGQRRPALKLRIDQARRRQAVL